MGKCSSKEVDRDYSSLLRSQTLFGNGRYHSEVQTLAKTIFCIFRNEKEDVKCDFLFLKNEIMIRYLALTVFFVLDLSARQVTLQPWTEVYGKVTGQGLGRYVTGIKPTANLPYRAAVSHGGVTSFYRLQNPTDTTTQLTITGEDLLLGDLNNDGLTDAVVVREALCYPGGYTCDTVYIYWE
jgi:hypothetical protein